MAPKWAIIHGRAGEAESCDFGKRSSFRVRPLGFACVWPAANWPAGGHLLARLALPVCLVCGPNSTEFALVSASPRDTPGGKAAAKAHSLLPLLFFFFLFLFLF